MTVECYNITTYSKNFFNEGKIIIIIAAMYKHHPSLEYSSAASFADLCVLVAYNITLSFGLFSNHFFIYEYQTIFCEFQKLKILFLPYQME